MLFDPYDVDSIAAAIWSIIVETELRQKLASRGLERSKKFSWSRTSAETAVR